jgi:hypothetical protein
VNILEGENSYGFEMLYLWTIYLFVGSKIWQIFEIFIALKDIFREDLSMMPELKLSHSLSELIVQI